MSSDPIYICARCGAEYEGEDPPRKQCSEGSAYDPYHDWKESEF